MVNDFTNFISIIVTGVLLVSFASQLEILKTKKIKKYKFSYIRYLMLLIFPLFATYYIYQIHGIKIIYIFISFSMLGIFFEWLVGFSYQMTLGEKLWEYHRLPLIGKYTSLLGIPLWGLAGVMFWLLSMIFI